MSMPRMSAAFASASSAVGANFTPPALPRPPVLTCALTITGSPSRSAAGRTSSTDVTTTCSVVGTPYFAKSSLACHSNRSTSGEVTDGRSGGVGGPDVGDDPVDDAGRGGAGCEDLGHTQFLQRSD